MSNSTSSIIIIDGPMGAGKTTVAKILHTKLPRTALLSWDLLKWMVNGLENTAEDKQMIADFRAQMAAMLLKNHISLIVEGGFLKNERLTPYLKLAKHNHIPLLHYFFVAPENVLLRRALSRPKPKTEKKKITKVNILQNIRAHITPPNSIVIDTGKKTARQVVNQILKDLT